MGRTFVGIAAFLGLLLAACGGGQGADTPAEQVRSLRGMSLVIASDAPFTGAADFDARLQTTIEAALRYWGGSWALVDGRTMRLMDTPDVECGGRSSLGCFDGREIRLTTRDPGVGTVACIEQTVLVHEIGHVVLGDVLHTDPRWMEMDQLAEELSGRVGYAETGTVPCETYPSVWRHPLGTP
jgi:hypothetical protein